MDVEESYDSLFEEFFVSDSEDADNASMDEVTYEDTDDDTFDNLANNCDASGPLQEKIRNWVLVFHISHVVITAILLIF